jgi:HSP20 family protein
MAALQHAQSDDQARLITLDVLEKAQQFEVRADLPGVPQDDIVLQADGNILTLSVEKKKKTEEQEGVRVHRHERVSTYAPRSIRLPESADLSQVQADIQNGVLEIIVPKTQKQKQRTIKVGSKAGSSS